MGVGRQKTHIKVEHRFLLRANNEFRCGLLLLSIKACTHTEVYSSAHLQQGMRQEMKGTLEEKPGSSLVSHWSRVKEWQHN